jgi:hypothetical protein
MVDNAVRVARRQLSGRLVFGALERPEGPYVPVRLAVNDMKDTRGSLGTGGEVDLLSLLVDPGAVVGGRVLSAEGEPVTPGQVVYTATSTPKGVFPCALPAGVAAVPLDANGRYEVRYVRQDPAAPSPWSPGPGHRSAQRGLGPRAGGGRAHRARHRALRPRLGGGPGAGGASGQPIAGAKVTAR